MDQLGDVMAEGTRRALATLGGDELARWELACMPDTASLRTRRAELGAQVERGRATLLALDEPLALGEHSAALARAGWQAALKRREAEIAALDAEISRAEERDRAAATRPPGCYCLGLGGRGLLLVVKGQLVWQEWCPCPDGRALLDAADRAREELDREEEARRAEEARVLAARELLARLAFARLPRRIEHGFEHFAAERPKAGAVARMRAFERPQPQRGVLLWGDFGTAKTTLVAAAVRAWIAAGGHALFTTLADYLEADRPQNGKTPPLSAEQVSRARSIGLLGLDDLGAERLTRWGRDLAFRLVNARYDARLPIVATSNYGLDELAARLAGDPREPDYDLREGRRIVERLVETCDVIELKGRNFRRPADAG